MSKKDDGMPTPENLAGKKKSVSLALTMSFADKDQVAFARRDDDTIRIYQLIKAGGVRDITSITAYLFDLAMNDEGRIRQPKYLQLITDLGAAIQPLQDFVLDYEGVTT